MDITLTADDARAFLVKINEGRVALGKEPLDKVDYTRAVSGSPTSCLSATSLFDGDGEAMSSTFTLPMTIARRLSNGTGWPLKTIPWFAEKRGSVEIPQEILRITDVFDNLEDSKGTRRDPVLKVFKEAELV